jgi:hypothetical protein
MKLHALCASAVALTLAFTCLIPNHAAAASEESKRFYEKKIDDFWYVGGNLNTTRNSACFAHVEFKDGSNAEIIRDLVDGELYLRVQNMSWNLEAGVDDKMKLRLNMHRGNAVVNGGTLDWAIVDKTTIIMGDIGIKEFMDGLWKSDTIRLIMPGNTSNAAIYIGRSHDVINALAECIKKFGPMDKPPNLAAPTAPVAKQKDKGGI